jgi:ParB-like chromosome segregation protein Spo0J
VIKRKTEQSAPLNAHATSPAEWVHVDYLKPNPRNPRKHGQEVLRLARTILRTTWGAPILAQRSTHRIIGGHGRLEAAREILAGIEVDGELRGGHEHVFAQGAPGPGFVPVRWLDVSDAEADAMALADNARGLQGEDDAVLIAEMAAQFGRESELMRDVGYSAEALDRMIAGAGDAIIKESSKSADPNGQEYDEDVERDVDALTCPHCGKLVPRG